MPCSEERHALMGAPYLSRPEPEYTLWGTHPRYAEGKPIRLISGDRSRCEEEARFRAKDPDWQTSLRPFQPVTRKPALCPQCGAPVRNWYQDNPADPGDVDPRADCTNPSCDWGY